MGISAGVLALFGLALRLVGEAERRTPAADAA
jgi:hypothetical protein